MRLFTQDIESLRMLYLFSLKKALDMERKIVASMTDIVERATDRQLQEALLTHLDETRSHVCRIETLLERRVGSVEVETCKAADSLATEASDTIGDVTDSNIRDIALIGISQQVEHHEIAVYGTLRRWARLLGLGEDAEILESIEAEEVNADETLSEIAARVNLAATV
jgi:ferritin-like metal-binding protein YciE